ncbi:MAG: GAF domain-containing protein [Elusimicrobia bacterium]|nr:GAF domain-containing protein [Elusimicrobiota bacterium]
MPRDAQENLQLLLDVCLLLASKIELPEVLTSIIELSSRVVDAETASLLLLDPESHELYFHVALGLDPEVSRIRLRLGEGIAGSVAKEGKPVIINDVRSDPRWSSSVDEQSGFQTRSILAAPMMIKGKLVGVVEAINHIEGPFSFDELRIFEAFASQAAIAIDNAQLFASLRTEKDKLDTVFARMRDAAVLVDDGGRILLANESAEKLFAVGAAQKAGIAEAMAQVRMEPGLKSILDSRDPIVRFEATRDDPKKLVLAGTASSLEFEGSPSTARWRGRLFVFRDVTEERREELLKRSFLSLISHKLKTPLSSITGYAQILMEESAGRSGAVGGDLAKKSIETILAQGKKLAELVDKLLRFTTLEEIDSSAFEMKPFKVDETIAEAVRSLEAWLKGHGGTVLVEAGSGLTVWGNPNLIRDVIKNLIENGIKFNTNSEKKVAIWAEARDAAVAVRVKDQGPGIPPEDQDRIFDKFYQIETSFTGQVDGWGLGLPFARRVLEHHGGTLTLESQLGKGTTVTVTLPRTPTALQPGRGA